MYDTTITVVGRIVDVPRRRLTESGVSVLNMRVASTARRLDRESGSWVNGDSLFLNVTCWRALADNLARSLVKGDAVIVHGRVYTREYEHNGQRRASYDMEAYAVGPDLTWGRVEFVRPEREVITHEVQDSEPTGEGAPDDAAELAEPAPDLVGAAR